MRTLVTILLIAAAASGINAQKIEKLKYADFENWVTRNIHESKVLGGETKKVYKIGPNATIDGNKPYTSTGGSP